ncbi:MAG: hypothetical protein OEV28_01275 [Nitrospirota bacterium]|nr:hypothetical protein [Nitrospirota bacterium]
MNDAERLGRKAKQFDTAGKAALLIGIVTLPFTGGKGDSLLYGLFLFLILKAISVQYRKKGLARAGQVFGGAGYKKDS